MPEDPLELELEEATLRWARRSSDVHVGLAHERLQDLVERLRRASSALSARGDDLTAGTLDDWCDRLRGLRDVLVMLESTTHEQRRGDRESRGALSPEETSRRLNLTRRLYDGGDVVHVHGAGMVVRHARTTSCADCERRDAASGSAPVPRQVAPDGTAGGAS
jgi:hypothetical protein